MLIVMAGLPGTGKSALAGGLAQALPAPADCCYVNNFQDPSRPACLCFPPGSVAIGGVSAQRPRSG